MTARFSPGFAGWIHDQLAQLDLALDALRPCPVTGCRRDAELCGWLTPSPYWRCVDHGTVIGP